MTTTDALKKHYPLVLDALLLAVSLIAVVVVIIATFVFPQQDPASQAPAAVETNNEH